jgi:hypothetical protein
MLSMIASGPKPAEDHQDSPVSITNNNTKTITETSSTTRAPSY